MEWLSDQFPSFTTNFGCLVLGFGKRGKRPVVRTVIEGLPVQLPSLIVNFGYLVLESAEIMPVLQSTVGGFHRMATWTVSIIHSEFWLSFPRVSSYLDSFHC